jgi:serine/threonine-protein phosphatase 2B catalytic subunit
MQVYDALMNCFDCLPLAAILNGRFLCVHGGLSPDVQTVQDIVNINRFREPPPSGPMTDLIWSDPMDEEEEEASPDALYLHNDLRGCSYVFSFNAVCQFLKNNNLLSVIRAHEAQDEGYRLYKKNASTGFPTVICIFSAPNYCDAYNNKAAIIRFQNNLMNIRQFNSSPHPYYLPNFMNAFSWSLPFVAEKVTDMLLTIWHLVDDEAEEARHEEGKDGVLQERGDKIRNKILAMGKVARIYKTLREENENILQLKGLAGGKVPVGILQQGAGAIQAAVTNFEGAKKCDMLNEKRPAFAGGPAPA